jgi:serine/threonine-protein kinase
MASNPQNDSSTLIHNSSASASSSLIGSKLNSRYLIEQEIKRGGFGIVYLARDLQLHSRPVVVKVLLEDSFKSDYVVQKFHQESEALSRIDHPGVVGLIDSGSLTDGKPYIVMQYVDGVTLRSVLKPEGMEMPRVALIIRQIGRALTAAHDKGIFHRDLKPENVMLQNLGHGEEQVKVIDFGIAKVKDSFVGQSTDTNVAVGTVSYMAPEQLSGKPVSAATDVYALGEIAYEMLAGRKPFNPETGFELLGLQREGVRINPRDLRPGLPAAAQMAILRALSFDPKDRYQRARDFGEDLAQALSGASDTSASAPDPTLIATEVSPTGDSIRKNSKSDSTIVATIPVVQTSEAAFDSYPDQTRLKHKLIYLIAGLGIVLVLIGGWFVYRKVATTPVNETKVQPIAERELNYWLTVQKMRDGKPYQDPFESSGQEIFEDGWRFRMNVSGPEASHLYLVNEGPGKEGKPTLRLLFPNPFTNSGSSQVLPGQQIQTGWMVFDENQGTERFWLVWSGAAVPELETVKGAVNEIDEGEIKDPDQAEAVRKFLTGSHPKAKAEKDTIKKQTNVKAGGNVIVHPIDLEHH